MWNKRLLASIILDKKKLKDDINGSCSIECVPTVNLLTKTEFKELRDCLNRATEILRESYIRSQRKF